MRKKLARISTMLLLVLSCLVMFELNCEAADGLIQISDASAAVGDTVNVTVKVDAGGDALGDCEATLTYDQAMLEFVDGTYAEESEDGIFLAQYGTGTETEFTFELQFIVLKEGKSELTLVGSTAYLYSDETLNLQATGGMISSEKLIVGEPVDINGTSYYFYEDFSEALILDGFSKGTLDYNGYTHNVIVQDLTGRTAAYFVKEDNNPTLMIYDDSTASFVSAEVVSISNSYYLILLENVSGAGIPDGYAETTIEINGTVLPAWQNMNETDYFLVYALSSEGYEGFYQYDSREGTYQRYTKPSSTIVEDSKFDNIILESINEFITDHLVYILAGAVILILIMIIVIIIMSSIVGKRNAELEDLYSELEDEASDNEYDEDDSDEYDFDYDDEYEYDEDDSYDYDDEYEYDEDDSYEYDDEYEYDEDDSDEYDFEYDLDDEEVEEKSTSKKRLLAKKKKGASKDTYEYNVDFIDL